MNPDIKKLEQQGVKETLVGDSRDPKFVAQAMKGVDPGAIHSTAVYLSRS